MEKKKSSYKEEEEKQINSPEERISEYKQTAREKTKRPVTDKYCIETVRKKKLFKMSRYFSSSCAHVKLLVIFVTFK